MPRTYRQSARADATAHTRDRILRAARAVFQDDGRYDLPLDVIAARAGVAVRTLLRHFGSREGLLEAALERAEDDVLAERAAAPGDVDGALARLAAHYEGVGPANRRMAAHEDRSPAVHRVLEHARGLHTRWTADVFAPWLEPLGPAARAERLAALATVCDLDVWLLLRERHGLPPAAATAVLRRLVAAELSATTTTDGASP